MTAGKDNVIGIDCCMTINQQSATNIYPSNRGVWLEAVVKSADYEYEITQKSDWWTSGKPECAADTLSTQPAR